MNIQSRISQTTTINFNRLPHLLAVCVGAGVVAGLASRISMRAVAILSGMQPEFSIGGTLIILIFGAIFGLVFGLPFFLLERLFPFPRNWKGLAYGFLLVTIAGVALSQAELEGELALISPTAILLIFAPDLLAFGLTLAVALNRLHRPAFTNPEFGLDGSDETASFRPTQSRRR